MHKYILFVLFLKFTLGSDNLPCEDKNEDTVSKMLTNPNPNLVTYTAAVLEYDADEEWVEEEKGYGVVRRNANNFVSYATEAKKQGAEILVTPEYGLESLSLYKHELENFITFAQYVPDPSERMVPCHFSGKSDLFEGMKILSCGAESNAIYLVVNLFELVPCSSDTISKAPWEFALSEECPEEGFFFYNTEVVFDRKGMLIARYRKAHLYTEYALTSGPVDDASAVFITDFNVAFSLQICYDIMFEGSGYNNVRNYGIRDVIMSTAWIDELPFNLADAIHNGWSRGLGTNFLVSGLHYPEKHCLGSGIYRSYSNDSVVYSYDKDSGNVLLIASLKTVAASDLDLTSERKVEENRRFKRIKRPYKRVEPLPATLNINEDNRYHSIFHQDLSKFTRVILNPGASGEVMRVSACSIDDFCCDLTYQYSGNEIYLFMVFSGRSFVIHGDNDLGVQQCGVVWCKTSDHNTCAHTELGLPESDFFGPFEISSSSFKSDVVFPIGNHRNLSLIPNKNLDFKINDNFFSIKARDPVKDHLSAALFGRWFIKDIIYDGGRKS